MKATDPRPSSRRGASGAWNRLKPVRDDTLETYGLPSKGETRLNDYKTQETYHNRIVERYMKFCASTNGDDLDKQFASLSLQPTSLSGGVKSNSSASFPGVKGIGGLDIPRQPQQTSLPILNSNVAAAARPSPNTQTTDLPAILAALRKLREALTATARVDQFAQRAYIFNVHAALLCRDWESYMPALLSLLYKIHPRIPLSSTELHEYVGYLILDQACRQGDLSGAHETRVKYGYKDRRVGLVLNALVADNWVVFWKMKKSVDGYQRRVMEFAEQGMRVHALKCLGRGYLSADRRFVERCAERKWGDLVRDGVGWELLESDKVVIKRPKLK